MESGDFFPCQAFFLTRTLFPNVRTNFLPLIKGDFFPCRMFSLSLRTFCPYGRFVPQVVLSPEVLSLKTFCPPGRFVPPDVFSPRRFVTPDIFSHGSFVTGRSVAGRFVWALASTPQLARVVAAPPFKW